MRNTFEFCNFLQMANNYFICIPISKRFNDKNPLKNMKGIIIISTQIR